MMKKFATSCAALILATAFSMPAQARAAHVKGTHVGKFSGARVAAAHRGIYRGAVWRGQYDRYGYGNRPYWGGGAPGVAAGFATNAAASAWPNNFDSYAYRNYGYVYINPYGGPRYPYYQRSYR
jgi:predicted MFS family arabinose efflux permease